MTVATMLGVPMCFYQMALLILQLGKAKRLGASTGRSSPRLRIMPCTRKPQGIRALSHRFEGPPMLGSQERQRYIYDEI